MGFWPFGKKDKDDDAPGDAVEYTSRVVTGAIADASTIRGKLVLHFREPVSPKDSDRAIHASAAAFEREMSQATSMSDLSSSEVANRVLAALPDNVVQPRSLEIVALHVVDEGAPSSIAMAPPVSKASPSSIPPEPGSIGTKPLSSPPSKLESSPPPKLESSPPKPGSIPPKPGSIPPAPSSIPPPRSQPPPAMGRGMLDSEPLAVPQSRKPSGQMLSARGERLVPFGASPEGAGKALVPLMRDASTKLALGILRAYDLLVVRQVPLDEGESAMAEAIVPVSSAPLGLFAESRADELNRWQATLGEDAYEKLLVEAATMVAYLFYEALRYVQIDAGTITTVVERMSDGASPQGQGAISGLGRYLHSSGGTAASALTAGVVKATGHASELKRLEAILTPLLASLQDDFAIAAAQVKSAIPKS